MARRFASQVARAAAWAVLCLSGPPPEAQDDGAATHKAGCPASCAACDRLVERALAHLAGSQSSEGSWSCQPRSLPALDATIFATAMSGLAFVACGHTTKTGPHQEVLKKCVGWLDREAANIDQGRKRLRHWSLAVTALFFAELQIREGSGAYRDRLAQLLKVARGAQMECGGWGHDPRENAMTVQGFRNFEYPADLAAVTVLMTVSLGSMKAAGVELPQDVQLGLRKYFSACETRDGGLAYATLKSLDDASAEAEAGRTAGAVIALQSLGAKEEKCTGRFLAFLRARVADVPADHGISGGLGLLWAGLACRLAGDTSWDEYRTVVYKELLAWRRSQGDFRRRPTAFNTSKDVYWSELQDTSAICTPLVVLIARIPARPLQFMK